MGVSFGAWKNVMGLAPGWRAMAGLAMAISSAGMGVSLVEASAAAVAMEGGGGGMAELIW